MTDGGGDLNWDQASLNQIAQGLKGAIGELKESGSSATSSLQGAGLSGLSLSAMEAGDGGLADAFEGFCEDWEWGVRALVQNANGLAERLGLAAGMAWSEDQYREGTFKVMTNAFSSGGNPHATEEEVAQQSYSEILAYDVDYSRESFEQAGEDITQNWQDTGRALSTEGFTGQRMDMAFDAAGLSEEQREAVLDEAYGPSPEERAAAQQQDQGGQD